MATMSITVFNALGQHLTVDDDMLASMTKKVALGTVNVTQTAAVLIASGVRAVTVSVPGVLAGEDVLLFPTAALPVGYSLGLPVATANGTLSVPVTGPALAVGGTYTIPCRAVVLR